MRRVNSQSRQVSFFAGLLSIGIFLALCWFVLGTAEGQQATAVRVFEGARLITGDGGAPITDAVFIVANGQFTAVGRRGQINVPAGAVRVDLSGKTVMPAIIDAHKHLAVMKCMSGANGK